MKTISKDEWMKICQGLSLARDLLYGIMKDHGIYPSVGNMKFIDEAHHIAHRVASLPPVNVNVRNPGAG